MRFASACSGEFPQSDQATSFRAIDCGGKELGDFSGHCVQVRAGVGHVTVWIKPTERRPGRRVKGSNRSKSPAASKEPPNGSGTVTGRPDRAPHPGQLAAFARAAAHSHTTPRISSTRSTIGPPKCTASSGVTMRVATPGPWPVTLTREVSSRRRDNVWRQSLGGFGAPQACNREPEAGSFTVNFANRLSSNPTVC